MSDIEFPPIERAIGYRPQPGDVLFLDVDFEPSGAALDRLHGQMSELLPGVKVVILTKGMRVAVVHVEPVGVRDE